MSRFDIQEAQYEFPYHYLPGISSRGDFSRGRLLNWGFEYLCYQRHLVERVRALSPLSLLEVGCGDGRFIGMVGDICPRRMGVDLVPRAISFAQAFHPEVDFQCMDLRDLQEDFDVVAAIEVLEHIPDEMVSGFLRLMYARIKPGGWMVLSVPTDVRPVHKKHYRHYNRHLLTDQLAAALPGEFDVKMEFVHQKSALIDWYCRLTANRLWLIDIPFVNNLIWRRVWRNRLGQESNGCHLIAFVRKAQK